MKAKRERRIFRRNTVFAVETTKAMSEEDIMDLCVLFAMLKKRYRFDWSQTRNPEWLRSLADEMEEDNKRLRDE